MKHLQKKRNGRAWLENDELCVLHHPGSTKENVLVEIKSMSGDTDAGHVIYQVVELASRLCYLASDEYLRRVASHDEVAELLKLPQNQKPSPLSKETAS